jgi:cell division protein FtsW (lipid II flippase)
VINIAVATVSVPTKGLSLPLVSAGGSGLVITAAALGLMYSVACNDPDECMEQLKALDRPRPPAPVPIPAAA